MGACFALQSKDSQIQETRLKAVDFSSMPLTSLEGCEVMARVVEVYDGDTITIGYDERGVTPPRDPHFVEARGSVAGCCCCVKRTSAQRREEYWVKRRLRMHGFDSPEMHPRKDSPLRELEKMAAQAARDALAARVLNRTVWVRLMRNEKFGRLCGTVFLGSDRHTHININQWMIDERLGKPFTGKTQKQPWHQQELEHMVQRYDHYHKLQGPPNVPHPYPPNPPFPNEGPKYP